MGSKLESLANSESNNLNYQADVRVLFDKGFKEAFKLVDENLTAELKKLEQYPFMGERIMTLKIYKAKIKEILAEMVKEYE